MPHHGIPGVRMRQDKNQAALPGQRLQLQCLDQRNSQRLVANNVNTLGQKRFGYRRVQMIRRHNGHGIDPTLASAPKPARSEEHTSELQSLMRISYAVFCLNNKNTLYT